MTEVVFVPSPNSVRASSELPEATKKKALALYLILPVLIQFMIF